MYRQCNMYNVQTIFATQHQLPEPHYTAETHMLRRHFKVSATLKKIQRLSRHWQTPVIQETVPIPCLIITPHPQKRKDPPWNFLKNIFTCVDLTGRTNKCDLPKSESRDFTVQCHFLCTIYNIQFTIHNTHVACTLNTTHILFCVTQSQSQNHICVHIFKWMWWESNKIVSTQLWS